MTHQTSKGTLLQSNHLTIDQLFNFNFKQQPNKIIYSHKTKKLIFTFILTSPNLQLNLYNQSMMVDYPRIVALLHDIQDPRRVKQAQRELQVIKDEPYFVGLLQHAFRDATLPHHQKMAAAILLNQYINDNYNDISIEKLLQLLMETMMDYSVDMKVKIALENSLTSVFQWTDPEFILDFVQEITNIVIQVEEKVRGVIQEIQNEDMNRIVQSDQSLLQALKVAMFLLKCLANSNRHQQQLGQALQIVFESSLRILNINSQPEIVSVLSQLCIFWKQMIQKLASSTSPMMPNLLNQICTNSILTEWIFALYQLDCKNGQCYLNANSMEEGHSLNSLKRDTAMLHKTMLAKLSNFNCEESKQIWRRTLIRSKAIVNTFTVYCSYQEYLADEYEQFATEFIGVLIILIKEHRSYFAEDYANLLHLIAFPLLAINDKQLILFEEEPQEFNSLNQDCCDHQKYGTLKTQSARLLQSICDQNYSAAQYVIQHCIISLKVKLSLDSNFNNSNSHFLKIQQVFLCLSILSYCLCKFTHQLEQLRSIIVVSNLKDKFGNLEMARFFSFLAYNYSDLYPQPAKGEQWVLAALHNHQHLTVSQCALDFISNVVDQYFSSSFVLQFADSTPTQDKNPASRLPILLKIISAHYSKLNQNQMCYIFQKLIKTVESDLISYHKKQKTHTMDIVGSLQCVRKLIDNGYASHKHLLRVKIWDVVNLLDKMTTIHLDDEIVKIVISLVRLQNIFTEQINNFLHSSLKLYKEDRQSQLTYLVFFNFCISLCNHQTLHLILSTLSQGLLFLKDHQLSNITPVRDRISIAAIYLLLQNIVALYGQNLGKEILGKLAELALLFIPQSDEPQDKPQLIVVARALNLLFLTHMHLKDDRALKRLLVFQDSPVFKGYDLKVLSLCLSKQIFRDADVVNVTQMINILTKAIWQLRKDSVIIKSKKNVSSIKSSSTRIKIKRVEDYEQILKFITTPFDKQTIPELVLRNIIDQMRTVNPYLYNAIIKSLPSTIYNNLKSIISQVTIEGKKRNILHIGTSKVGDTTLMHIQSKKRQLQKCQDDSGSDEQLSKNSAVQKKKKRFIQTSLDL